METSGGCGVHQGKGVQRSERRGDAVDESRSKTSGVKRPTDIKANAAYLGDSVGVSRYGAVP